MIFYELFNLSQIFLKISYNINNVMVKEVNNGKNKICNN